MKMITREMIRRMKINKFGFDYMGYTFGNVNHLSYHHLLIPRRLGGKETFENGAILVQKTSHEYLHTIEYIDPEIFYLITAEMVEQNLKGKLDVESLKHIRDLLLYFEKEHYDKKNKKGKRLIKREYIKNRIDL